MTVFELRAPVTVVGEYMVKIALCKKDTRNDYDEEAAYESYMNPEPGFQSGLGDAVDAD